MLNNNILIRMNFKEYKIYIDKLCTMSNNYYCYDDKYIKNKYNIDSYEKFRKYFKKLHSDKLIFNSLNAELFFIKIMNIDNNYIFNKYNNPVQTILNFFILHSTNAFNNCDELISLTGNHTLNCKCKIKVKSVVNLSINALIYILFENNIVEKKTDDLIVKKLYNTSNNKKIIDCIVKIENAKNNLGLSVDNIVYELTDTNNYNVDIIPTPNNNQTLNKQFLSDSVYLNNNVSPQSLSNVDKSESNMSTSNDNITNIVNTNNEESTDNETEESNDTSNEESNDNETSNEETIVDEKVDNKEVNRYGRVLVYDDKVKIEKLNPEDLENTSDIMISYNAKDDIIKSKNETSCKMEVIEILNYLDNNFNYITTDDILIDKDKKMQICTFMVEIKYKIHELLKHVNTDVKTKIRITKNYEQIYEYVVQSNNIGNTGEMIEFSKNKQKIYEIIKDINRIE